MGENGPVEWCRVSPSDLPLPLADAPNHVIASKETPVGVEPP